MTKFEITEHEARALAILAGDSDEAGGAWFNACCEYLCASGYATGPSYQAEITEKGLAALRQWRESNDLTELLT